METLQILGWIYLGLSIGVISGVNVTAADKLDILWTMLDAMWMAYVEKRPPFAGCPDA